MKVVLLNEKDIEKNPYSRLIISNKTSHHTHTFFEFSISISGEYKNYINGECYEIKKGRIILLRPEDKHYILAESPHSARDVYVLPEVMKSVCDCIDPSLYDRLNNKPLVIDFEVNNYDLQQLENKLNFFNNPIDEHPLTIKTRHRNVIFDILDLWQQNFSAKSTNLPFWLSQLLAQLGTEKFITKNVDEIILTTNYSHGYVCRCFKKYMGKTLQEHLNDVKFSYSLSLLQNKENSVSQIAEKLNYCATSNFIIAFKNRYGMTPAQWRRTH